MGIAHDVIGEVQQGSAQGLQPYDPNDQFASLYPTICQRNQPANTQQVWNGVQAFSIQCEANLRARGLIYFKKMESTIEDVV